MRIAVSWAKPKSWVYLLQLDWLKSRMFGKNLGKFRVNLNLVLSTFFLRFSFSLDAKVLEIDFLQKFAKFDSNLGGLRERIWQPALLLVSANRSCGRIHAAWSRWRVFCSGACNCCSGFLLVFCLSFKKTSLNSSLFSRGFMAGGHYPFLYRHFCLNRMGLGV